MVLNAIIRLIVSAAITAGLLFWPAGNVFWGRGWLFMLLFFIPMALIAIYLFRCDRELLKRRLQTKESKPKQGLIANLFYASIGLTLVTAGLDNRYGWSSVPEPLVLISAICFLVGYFFLFLVFKENRYLAHTVVTEEGQRVVTTGPYAVVRHPMYLSQLVMFIFAPMLLGSYVALISLPFFLIAFVARIIKEEEILLQELPGYREYTKMTRYRLVPCLW
jgi:protein-S-isoprenylcysteine O-methyltransferase Ste14